MFDMDLLTYFELGHSLRAHHNISMTEYNAMMPWHRDINVELIKQEIEARQNTPQS